MKKILSVFILIFISLFGILLAQKSNTLNTIKEDIRAIPIGQSDISTSELNQLKKEPQEKVFSCLIGSPQFPGGKQALYQFIMDNLKYPDLGCAHVAGTVLARFEVAKDGTVHTPTIIRSVHPALDNEVLRLINLMPKWIPIEGEDSYFILPIIFRIAEAE